LSTRAQTTVWNELVSMDLEFDDFASEPKPASTQTGAITIGAVLAASMPLHWDEAVAVLQELIVVMTSSNRDDIPAFDDVVIDPNGTLTTRGTRRGERGPVAAGRALHALLATADVPVALRLFVTQANAPETHASLPAFAKGLAYFGKSDRAELIRGIYARYKPTAATTQVPSNPATSPQASRTPPASRPAQRPSSRRTLQRGLVAAAVIVFLATAGAVTWLLITRGPRPVSDATRGPKSASTAPAAPPVKHAADSSAPRVATTKTHSLDRPVSQAATVQPSLPPRRPATLSRPESIRVPARGDVLPSDAGQALLSPRTGPARAPSSVGESTRETAAALTNAATRDHAVAGTSAAIYSNDDADVQPPVMLFPQLPPPLMIGGPSDGRVNRMELVVAPDGSVERVRLIGAPSRMPDMMLLSGAKLWKFTPAVKDGVQVRYRTMVTWTVFP
jgi:hypothetical protein